MNQLGKSRFDILYQKHLSILKLQGKADKTIDAYSRAVRRLADFVDRCPDDLTIDELKAFFSALINTRSWSTVKLDLNGLRFFYKHVLALDLPWLNIVRPPKVQSLPDVLTPNEIAMHHQQCFHRSCGNRSCPQCQHHTSAAWLERQQAKLLPTNYFMITFTLPAQLRALAYANPKLVYCALFDVAIDTLNTFAKNEPQLNGRLGAHTHSRRLDYHPHVHLIVPGAALDPRRKQWRKIKGRYLFNGKNLAKVFRPRMIAAINDLQLTIPDNPKCWNVQCKFVGKGLPALKYLSRYLYRGVVNERDLIDFDPECDTVSFRYRDGKTGEQRLRTLSLGDFLWRISMQVLPKGFRRVRDYGYLHGNARSRLVLLQVIETQTPPSLTSQPCRTPSYYQRE